MRIKNRLSKRKYTVDAFSCASCGKCTNSGHPSTASVSTQHSKNTSMGNNNCP